MLAAVEACLKVGDVFAELLGLEVGGVDERLDLDLGLVEPAGDLLDELQVDQVVLELLLELEDDLDGLVGVALLDFLELFESAGLAVVEELGEFLQAFLVGVDLVGAEVAAGGEVLEGDAELGVGAAQERELFVHVGAEGAQGGLDSVHVAVALLVQLFVQEGQPWGDRPDEFRIGMLLNCERLLVKLIRCSFSVCFLVNAYSFNLRDFWNNNLNF